jgi:hypothetical protein
VGREVNTDELIEAQGVADLLGLAQRNTVSLSQRRYAEARGRFWARALQNVASGRDHRLEQEQKKRPHYSYQKLVRPLLSGTN